jgi:hypothetical protein
LGTLQAWQVPAQALLQQYPSTQKPERQRSLATQAVPSGCFGTQAPATHAWPGLQSASSVQPVEQAPRAPAQ